MTQTNILDVPMQRNDAGAATIGEYFVKLLDRLWEEEESFSGKRPFGNSSWYLDLHVALIHSGHIKGKLDEDGYIEESDDAKANALISQAIASLYVKP